MVVAELSVIPVGTGTPSVGQYVTRAIRILQRQKKVKYQLTAMGTILEGELAEVLAAAMKVHEGLFGGEVKRVVTKIVIDDRRDKKTSLDYKVRSVEEKLAEGQENSRD